MTRTKTPYPLLNPSVLQDWQKAPLWQERQRLLAEERAWLAQWFKATTEPQRAKIALQLVKTEDAIAANAQAQGLPVYTPPSPYVGRTTRQRPEFVKREAA